MPGVTVQFHMLFDEMVDYVREMMTRFSLAVELEQFFSPATRVVTSPADLADEIARFGHVDRMWFLCKPPRARKFERFSLLVGRQKGRKLEQSHLGAVTDKAKAFKTLKQIAYQLRKRTIGGDEFGTLKFFRVSPGAAKAMSTGKLKLTGIGGSSF
jgi:hypothetical protein